MSFVSRDVVRIAAFWGIAAAVVLAASFALPFIDLALVGSTFIRAWDGSVEGISKQEFAFALAGALASFAAGLALAFLLLHVIPIRISLRRASRVVAAAQGRAAGRGEIRKTFAAGFENVRESLERNALIGHAWVEFEETLSETDSHAAIRNTVRPQVFFTPGLARERFTGLKLMNAVPGYFVGVGLLLTFIGLVFALYKAGAVVTVADATKMTGEIGDLLKIATFKFSTSIAGLGASIVLALLFRWYFILIETGFDRFNTGLERGLLYVAPQSIALEMNRTLQEQLVELKDITQGEFFRRMGAEIGPQVNVAISSAMAPVAEQIRGAVGSLTANSQDGVQSMLRSFVDSLQHGAGSEMRELAATLKQLQTSVAEMQGGLRGSGDDFSAKLGEAAANLNRMVERAGQSFEGSSAQSRDALAAVTDSLRQTLERANSDMHEALGAAAGGASTKLEEAMGAVMEKLDRQIGQVGNSVAEMQRAMGEQGALALRHIEASVTHSSEAQGAALANLQDAARSVAEQLRTALTEVLNSVGRQFSELAISMRAIEGALLGQRTALEATSGEARKVAQALGESATSVRAATAPLVSVGHRFTSATEQLASSVATTLDALAQAQDEVTTLAASLGETNQKAGVFWSGFATKFEDVDTSLAKAVQTLSNSTTNQQQRLEQHVRDVDMALAKAIEKLAPLLGTLSESAEEIADSLQSARSVQ